MLNFCTLYNSNYSAKGLVMYESLLKHCPSFHLYIFAFDDELIEILRIQNLEHVTVVSLAEFEDEKLLETKKTRTKGEYCWTCSSSTILYCIEKFNLDCCTYIDADLCFYSDPTVLVEEMGDKDVLITSHRYTPKYDQSKTSGKYCVQFMTFKNTPNGMKVLNWWRNACLEWCYARMEDGKFGDQKYLDDWTERFEGIHELMHLGGGVAPWNMQQYEFQKDTNGIVGKVISTGEVFPLVFFHFHNMRCSKKGLLRYFVSTPYDVTRNAIDVIYKPYYEMSKKAFRTIKSVNRDIDGLATSESTNESWWLWIKVYLYRLIHGEYRIHYWFG